MTKQYTPVPIGNGVRHRMVLTDEPSSGAQIAPRQHAFLADWVNNGIFNGLFRCGPIPFQTMNMIHKGGAWVITMEAVEGVQ